MSESVEQVLGALVIDTPDGAIPDAARVAARVQVYDAIGVSLAAAVEPAGRKITEVVADLGGAPQARVLGTAICTSTVHAAWANGSLAHLLDFDDVGFSHPTACIYPAALAVGERLDVSGREFLSAMVLGYEVFERLAACGRADDPRLRVRGYHPTPIYGCVAAAAAAGRLLRLDTAQLVIAMSLAATDASGLTQQFGTWAKGIHAGNAARTGVLAALLAGRGYWADERGLSGPRGLFSALHGEGRYDFGPISDGLGTRWSILDPGLGLKVYPACGSSRRAVDAVLELAHRPGFDPDRVTSIRVDVHPHVFNQLRFRAPDIGFRGKFSLDYAVAAAVLDGQLAIESFSDAAAARPEFRAMLGRVELHEHPDWDISNWREMPVEITMTDGTVLRARVSVARGTRANPLSQAEIQGKFLDCARRALPLPQARRATATTWELLDAPRLRDVVDAVVTAGDPASG